MNSILVMSKFEPEYTGPGVRMIKLYNKLKDMGLVTHCPPVYCGSKDYSFDEKYSHKGFSVRRITIGPLNLKLFRGSSLVRNFFKLILFLKSLFVLFHEFSENKVSTVHCLGSSGVVDAAIVLSYYFRKRCIVELVNRESDLPILPRLLGVNFRKISILVISRELLVKMHSRGLSENTIYKPNPVDLGSFKKKKVIVEGESVVIGYVSSFLRRKNHELLIDAMQYLPKNFKLKLMGPITDKSESVLNYNHLDDKVKKNNLTEIVDLKSGFFDVSKEMCDIDVYAIPAINEGLGTTLLEAIACNIPVVANKNEPAFKEWVFDGVNGFLSDIDPKSFAQSIEQARCNLNFKDLDCCNEKLRSIFSLDNVLGTYISLFLESKDGDW